MKFKPGDKVKVTHKDHHWIFWMSEMDDLVGKIHTIHGEWELAYTMYPTIVIKDAFSGCSSNRNEYGIPEHCLELAIKPGEQLLFSFMNEVVE
ncbi:MAG: hypothetical protein IMZ70_05845 [Candidatus Atribacteria bacterium]|nr:hypothetical protein [Candidatus Atribacteria bacterium]